MKENANRRKDCEYPGCTHPAAPTNFTVRASFFTVRVSVPLNARSLCKRHLLIALTESGKGLDERNPGAGKPFARKAFCFERKESVSFAECQTCFRTAEAARGYNHLGCQKAHLSDPRWEKGEHDE